MIADDHRADALGVMGHPVVQTPELDALARAGTVFTQARIGGGLSPAVCAPSRACLLTGNPFMRAEAQPHLNRTPEYAFDLPAGAVTLPQHFRAAGYETFLAGKWHNDVPALLRSFEGGENIFHGGMAGHQAPPVRDLGDFAAGRDARPAAGFSTEVFCRSVADFVRRRKSDRPFFAWLALTSPHDPRTPPAEFRARYDPAALPLPANFRAAPAFDNGELAVRDERLAPRPLTAAVLREHLADYYGMISHHDAWLGHVRAALRERGQEANTIVVYLSDHGLALGSHGLLGKQNLYEPSVRVPVILAGPGVPAGRRCDALAYGFDLYATLCELADLAPPPGLDSRSLVPVLQGRAPAVRAEVAGAYMDCQRMVTDGRWKLIVYRVAGAERRELFDLREDPDELRDLAADPRQAERVAELTARLAAWREENGDRWFAPCARAGAAN